MHGYRWSSTLALAAALWLGCGDDGATPPDAATARDDAAGTADAAPPDATAADAAPPPDAAPTADAAPPIDAAPPATACDRFDTPAAVLADYPSAVAVDLNAGTAMLDAADAECAEVDAPFGVSTPGREQIILLEGLVAGTEYGVQVTAGFDASFYVVTGCTGEDGPAPGECLVFVDTFADPETATFVQPSFVAPTDGVAYVVVDHWDTTPPASGGVQVTVAAVECASVFDCADPTAPVCWLFSCVAGPSDCVGDDPSPPEHGDDGPAGATALALDEPAAAAVCSAPARESDFYRVALAADGDLHVGLAWLDSAADLDLRVFDADGAALAAATSSARPERLTLTGLTAGDYYVQVDQFETYVMGAPTTTTAVTAYTVEAYLAECVWDGHCTTPGSPLCGDDARCAAGYDACTGDDATEQDDDGAGLAKTVSPELDGPALDLDAHICSAPAGGAPGSALERDWYAIDVAAGQALGIALTWSGGEDLDVAVFDGGGALVDEAATSSMPEMLALTPAAGRYFIAVEQYAPVGTTAAAPYRLSIQLSTAP